MNIPSTRKTDAAKYLSVAKKYTAAKAATATMMSNLSYTKRWSTATAKMYVTTTRAVLASVRDAIFISSFSPTIANARASAAYSAMYIAGSEVNILGGRSRRYAKGGYSHFRSPHGVNGATPSNMALA